jgi:hypothetical protein
MKNTNKENNQYVLKGLSQISFFNVRIFEFLINLDYSRVEVGADARRFWVMLHFDYKPQT